MQWFTKEITMDNTCKDLLNKLIWTIIAVIYKRNDYK